MSKCGSKTKCLRVTIGKCEIIALLLVIRLMFFKTEEHCHSSQILFSNVSGRYSWPLSTAKPIVNVLSYPSLLLLMRISKQNFVIFLGFYYIQSYHISSFCFANFDFLIEWTAHAHKWMNHLKTYGISIRISLTANFSKRTTFKRMVVNSTKNEIR